MKGGFPMIISIEELRKYVPTTEEDSVLEARLQALEASIQGYTNNDFKRVLEANGGEYPADIKMGVANMLNTLMNTAYQLLLDTVFYIMAIAVLAGAGL